MKRARVLGLAWLLGACAADETLRVEVDLVGARSAVLVTTDAAGAHARAFAPELLESEPILLDTFRSAELFTFAEALAPLRLSAEPVVRGASECAIDELDTASATLRLCYADGAFTPCAPRSILLERSPYLGEPCFAWDFDLVGETFDLGAGHGGTTVLVGMPNGYVLAGQTGTSTGSTVFRMLERDLPAVSPDGERFEVPGVWSAGAARDARRAWLMGKRGELASLDTASGAISTMGRAPVRSEVSALVASPDDGEVFLAATRDAALLRYAHGRWTVLASPLSDEDCDAAFFCGPEIDWSRGDEALVVGLALGAEVGAPEARRLAARRLYRVRGSTVTPEPLSWPPELPDGLLRAVGSYRAEDGTWVDVLSGTASGTFPSANGAAKIWYVRDPRRGAGWTLLPSEVSLDGAALRRMAPWRDGVVAVGAFAEGFSDRHWVVEPLAARSKRRAFGRIYSRLVADGRGGFLASAVSDEPGRFLWMRAP